MPAARDPQHHHRDHRQAQEDSTTSGDGAPTPLSRRPSPLEDPPIFAERDYRIASSDARGRTERVWVRLPPYLIRIVQTIVSKGPYPWQTPSDAYRFAIYWGLRLLQHNPPEAATIFAQVQAMNDILVREEDHQAFKAVFDRATNVLNEYQREGAMDEARRVLGELDARINQMAAGYWKTKYAKTLRERFGPMMRGEKMLLMAPERKLRIAAGQEADIEGDAHAIDWSQVADGTHSGDGGE